MPTFREWVIHHPRDWTSQQAQSYMRDTTMGFTQAIQPVQVAVGPVNAVAVLLTVVTQLARANPVFHENIKDHLANVYDLIESIDPMKGLTKQ